MKKYFRHILSVSIAISIGVLPAFSYAGKTNALTPASTNTADQKAKESISYLLSVDRLHFYIQNLADQARKFDSESSVVGAADTCFKESANFFSVCL